MPQVSISLSESIVEEIEQQSKNTGRSFSRVAADLIDLGLKVNSMNQKNELSEIEKKKKELEDKHTEFLLRIMNISSEILRCVYDPVKIESKSKESEKTLSEIKEKMQLYIKGFTGVEQ